MLFVIGVLVLGVGCPRSSEPRPIPDPVTTKGDTTGAAASTTVAASEGLPPFDDACTSDADCAVYGFAYGPGGCCNICNDSVGAKRWITRAAKACDDTLGWSKSCPMMSSCVEVSAAACVANHCKPAPDPLGPVDLACATDADCVAHDLYYSKSDGGCCQSCSNWVSNTSWYARAQKRCHDTIGYGKDCPVKKCAPPDPVACKSGKCAWSP